MSVEQDQLLALQMSVDEHDEEAFAAIIEPHSGEDLGETQIFGDASLLMYACHKGTPAMVSRLLSKGLEPLELPFSDNNEIKACCLNPKHGADHLQLVLNWMDPQLARDMTESDWGLEGEEASETALDLAKANPDPRCLQMLQDLVSKL